MQEAPASRTAQVQHPVQSSSNSKRRQLEHVGEHRFMRPQVVPICKVPERPTRKMV